MKTQFLDIDAVLAAKAPRLSQRLPRFLVSYLKRIVHQDEINEIFDLYGDLSAHEFAAALIKHFDIAIELRGEEKMPMNGRCTFASNHPLGGMDGVALMDMLSSRYGSVKSPVNDLLLYVYPLRDFLVPVNKLGAQSRQSAEQLAAAMESDEPLLYFPAGKVSRKNADGIVEDEAWQKSFVVKSIKYGRDIVPIFFDGLNSRFFYNLAYYRTRLGVKQNIEMLYLADELFKSRGKQFTITIGDPIAVAELAAMETDAERVNRVRTAVYAMKNADRKA